MLRMGQSTPPGPGCTNSCPLRDLTPGRRAQAGFLLGETYEALQLTPEAIKTYESILEDYPNPQAVRARLEFLRK